MVRSRKGDFTLIQLKYFTEEDFDLLHSWIHDFTFLHQWAGHSFTYPLTDEQLYKYLEDANQDGASKLIYKAIDKVSNKVIGHISIGRIDQTNENARIGRVLIGDSNYLGKGIGTEMVRQCARIIFEDLEMNRASLGVFDFNKAAIRSYEKAGFVQEGKLRQARKFGDEYWSLIEMSLLKEEWNAYKD